MIGLLDNEAKEANGTVGRNAENALENTSKHYAGYMGLAVVGNARLFPLGPSFLSLCRVRAERTFFQKPSQEGFSI